MAAIRGRSAVSASRTFTGSIMMCPMMGQGIVPDTKDWTWVLDRPCPDCGYDASTISVADLPHLIRANAMVWLGLLGDPDVAVRPEPEVWSPLEYACHVHDVHQVFHERLT